MINNKTINVILDFEWTCWDKSNKPLDQTKEIIAIGAIKVDEEFNILDEFYELVKPEINPILSNYCKNLTNINQRDVDKAKPFLEIIPLFEKWVEGTDKFSMIYSWGKEDFRVLSIQSQLLNYESKIKEWILSRKVTDISSLLLKDIREELNIPVNIGLYGALKLYGVNSIKTHNPLQDTKNLNLLWKTIIDNNPIVNTHLLESARHMYVINQLKDRVIFRTFKTYWLSENSSSDISNELNKSKLHTLYKYLSDIKSTTVVLNDTSNFYRSDDYKYHHLKVEPNLDKENHIEFTATYEGNSLNLDINVINRNQELPIECIKNHSNLRSLANITYIDNGLFNESITLSEKNINMTLCYIKSDELSRNPDLSDIIIVINGIIIWLYRFDDVYEPFKKLIHALGRFELTPYPL